VIAIPNNSREPPGLTALKTISTKLGVVRNARSGAAVAAALDKVLMIVDVLADGEPVALFFISMCESLFEATVVGLVRQRNVDYFINWYS
jgi:hypothetical protein